MNKTSIDDIMAGIFILLSLLGVVILIILLGCMVWTQIAKDSIMGAIFIEGMLGVLLIGFLGCNGIFELFDKK